MVASAATDAVLDELHALVESAGLVPAARLVARRARPDAATYVGSGKVEEIGALIEAEDIDLVVFDQPISAVQQRNLGQRLQRPVHDRTELILEIFAQRARSTEGRLQVELARLRHLATRLVRGWSHLERQRGGIGMRGGPGETQLELDRRMIDQKVRQLRQRLDTLARQRRTRRRARDRRDAFKVSVVGYTNAGKSTLFNALTSAGTYAADQLFATLDTLTRRLRLDDGTVVTLSDTVGFVRDLPHSLVEAFAATLEETAEADLLLHVVDASNPERDRQIEEVERVLAGIGADAVPRITVFNKIDMTGVPPRVDRDPCGRIDRVFLSASRRQGLDLLRAALAERAAASATGPAGIDEPGDRPAGSPDPLRLPSSPSRSLTDAHVDSHPNAVQPQ